MVCATETVAAPPGAGRLWRARMATAARQDLWRRLSRMRGLAPVVHVVSGEDRAQVTLAAVFLDGAAATSGTLDALRQIFHEGGARRWRRWADRAASEPRSDRDAGPGGCACSRRS
ncbi:hypothetical protein [Rubrimonas cliftonensis]|uniref:hypothetical protein n=1 Tax=Rubrimonas cliftonensis TaxID=89524 RepID=UPI000AD1734A|nr:hypothetical protein [Rubrimonas cliftonensis]